MIFIWLSTAPGTAVAGSAVSVYAEDATVTVTGVTLSVTPANVSLAGVALDGTDKTPTATSTAWTAKDRTRTGAGWQLTIAATDFTTDKIQNIDSGSSTAGTFIPTYNGQTTASIDYDAAASAVERTATATGLVAVNRLRCFQSAATRGAALR